MLRENIIKNISFDLIIEDFEKALAHHWTKIIIDIWNSSEQLRQYYSGEVINVGTAEHPDFRSIPFNKLISGFREALYSQACVVIKSIWNKNKILQNYYSGIEINVSKNEVQDLRILPFNKLLIDVDMALSSQTPTIVKAIWLSNKLLRQWFGGQVINVGTEDNPDMRCMSFDDLLNYFNKALISKSRVIIQYLWKYNVLLPLYFSQERVDVGTVDTPDWRTMSFADLINLFKLALSSQYPEIIKTVWNGNENLRKYLNGSAVNFGTNEKPVILAISFDELISLFRLALSSTASFVINDIWNSNEILRNYLNGGEVDVGNTQKPDRRLISLDELIEFFKAALRSKNVDLILELWNKNENMRNYFTGYPVNFGTEDILDLRALSPDKVINHFKSALSCKISCIVQQMWNGSPFIRIYFSGKAYNFGTEDVPNWQSINTEDLIKNFKSALSSRISSIIKVMWESNNIIQNYFCGLPCDFGTQEEPDWRTISQVEIIEIFKSALSSHSTEIVLTIWEKNHFLRNYFNGEVCNFGTQEEPNWCAISHDEVIINFKSILSYRRAKFINQVWNNNEKLRSYFSGNAVNFGTEELPNWQQLPPDEMLKNFKSALASHNSKVTKYIWENNEKLRNYIRGEAVNFGTEELPNWQQLSSDELIEIFKSILASHCHEVQIEILTQNNVLQRVIKTLNSSQSQLLLKKVMCSSSAGYSNFISQYLDTMVIDVNVVQNVLDGILRTCKSDKRFAYKRNQIRLLKDRLVALSTQGQQSNNTNNDLIVPVLELSSVKEPKQKKRRANCSEIASFVVLPQVGLDLQKLFSGRKKELTGISVKKLYKKNNYEVKIIDLEKYHTFLKQYVDQKQYARHAESLDVVQKQIEQLVNNQSQLQIQEYPINDVSIQDNICTPFNDDFDNTLTRQDDLYAPLAFNDSFQNGVPVGDYQDSYFGNVEDQGIFAQSDQLMIDNQLDLITCNTNVPLNSQAIEAANESVIPNNTPNVIDQSTISTIQVYNYPTMFGHQFIRQELPADHSNNPQPNLVINNYSLPNELTINEKFLQAVKNALTAKNKTLKQYAVNEMISLLTIGKNGIKADVNYKDNESEMTVLHCAIHHKNAEITKLLLELKADVNLSIMVKTFLNKTTLTYPLHLAVQNEDFLIVKLLVEHGANLHQQNSDNKTALDIAEGKFRKRSRQGQGLHVIDTTLSTAIKNYLKEQINKGTKNLRLNQNKNRSA